MFVLVGYDGSYRFESVKYYIVDESNVTIATESDLLTEIKPTQSEEYQGMSFILVGNTPPEAQGVIGSPSVFGFG